MFVNVIKVLGVYKDYGTVPTKNRRYKHVRNFPMPSATLGYFDGVSQGGLIVVGCLIKINEDHFFKLKLCWYRDSNTKVEMLVHFHNQQVPL